MKKKTYIIIVAIVLVVAIAAAVALIFGNKDKKKKTDSTASTPSTSSVDNEEAVEEGTVDLGTSSLADDGIYSVPIKISDNPGIFAYKFDLGFDNKNFELVGIDNGLISPMQHDVTAGLISIIGVENDEMKENGTLFTLKFKEVNKVAPGEYPITLNKYEISNYDEVWVKPEFKDGKIVVGK